MAQYAYIGVGRDDGQQKGEFSAIFYDTTRFSLVRQGTFWLSTQSERPSVGWDAMMERICTYGFFVHRASGRELLCLNTHFDHKGKKARRKSSRLILRKVKELNERGLPVIVMGDLNSEPESRPIALLCRRLADSFTLTERPPEGPAGTFNGFDLQVTPDRRIDYVLVTGFAVETYAHLDDRTRQGRYISDHLPVWVTLRFASPD